MRGNLYQLVLIGLSVVVTLMFGAFLVKELKPEYRIYQNDYYELEKFRSTLTGQPPPPFSFGVKQIVMEQPNHAPAKIDRCTSCHVAVQFEHFSPTRIKRDINGEIVRDSLGVPEKEPNPSYIWGKLEDKVELLLSSGKQRDKEEADKLLSLKTATVGEHHYDVTKVLQMHPLIGKETRPFEFHPIDEYGCTSCHSGNGRGLTTEKAHGPVFDEQYEAEFTGPTPLFLEPDPENDPLFSKVFNHKPGHGLLFQTTPILVGDLIQSRCIDCHTRSSDALITKAQEARVFTARRKEHADAVEQAYLNEKKALTSLIQVRQWLQSEGYEKTLELIKKQLNDFRLPPETLEHLASQEEYLRKAGRDPLQKVNREIQQAVGSEKLAAKLEEEVTKGVSIETFIKENLNAEGATGPLFEKWTAYDLEKQLLKHVKDTEFSFERAVNDKSALSAIQSDVDRLTQDYHEGQKLFISQACYACHRISGLARGGVGPELTDAGDQYPWYLKESIVWPQADLKTSTMPNFRLDHKELEDLMTFLLAQKGRNQAVSETAYKISLADWEAGAKLPWEKPATPAEMHNVDYGMEVFATEGCAACHRLKGYESTVGFAVEKEEPDFDTLYKEREWFTRLFPEEIQGSLLAERVQKHADEIDRRIVQGVREDAILEKIRKKNPQAVDGLYPNFRYASRAQNKTFSDRLKKSQDPVEREKIHQEQKEWQDRVHRVLMVYVQEYGLGRLIGPRPNWSGVYRSDEWLMEHFWNPQSHVARSIMPTLPFDDTKFYALTYMLDVLGKKNRDAVREIWEHRGFNPEQAYEIFCEQCHGNQRMGNGPIAEWIYPIPKNLRSGDFLRNLTKANATHSIVHGVKGGPMPPWGEAPDNKPDWDGIPVITRDEINTLVEWLYSTLPGKEVFEKEEDVPKWQYQPEDAIQELEDEGDLKKLLSSKASPLISEYFASAETTYQKQDVAKVSDIFDVIPNPSPEGEEKLYYIKEKYYTPENLEAAKVFFNVHCATCHGREGDGSGDRAGTMRDAKPRMLTNLNWLDTRDDLRLLRSLKYGVVGTAMTPWGDQTSSLQRLQLIMYIRSLSHQSKLREQLLESLYVAFRQGEIAIEKARVEEYPKVALLDEKYSEAKKKRDLLDTKVILGEVQPVEAVSAYETELKLFSELNKAKEVDEVLLKLRNSVSDERKLFEGLGMSLVNRNMGGELFEQLDEAIRLNGGRFTFQDGELVMNHSEKSVQEIDEAKKFVIKELDERLSVLSQERRALEGRIASAERTLQLKELNAKIQGLQDLKNRVIADFEAAARGWNYQKTLYEQYVKGAK